MTGHDECRETVTPERREEMLVEYKHRCQGCGRRGPAAGGLATLHVHHLTRDPDGMGEHDAENLTVLCRACHSWLHQQSTPDESPVELTEADRSVLLPQDIGILQYLAENGPTRTGDIASELGTDLTVSAIRERLWVVMGLDNRVESRDRQIVDKDVETGEWGLADQVENSARGHIPDDQQLLLQRMEDEQVKQALERGCDRSAVTDVLGISRRTTFNKVKRAYAYGFPLAAFSRGGRPPSSENTQATKSVTGEAAPPSERDDQQQLDDMTGQDDGSLGRTETWGTTESTESTGEPTTQSSCVDGHSADQTAGEDGVSDELQGQLQQAIDALQDVTKHCR